MDFNALFQPGSSNYSYGNMPNTNMPVLYQTWNSGGGSVPKAPTVPNISAPNSVISGGDGGGYQYDQWGRKVVNATFNPTSHAWEGGQLYNPAPATGGAGQAAGGGAAGNVTAPGATATNPNGQPGLVTNPFSQAAINSTVAAGNASAGQGQANLGQADMLRALATQGGSAAGQVLNTGFDPQNALYDRTLRKLQDQVRVGEAGRGITMSPYGAGVENQALSDFNIDWADRALGRQTQALGAYGSALGQIGSGSTSAGNIGQQGVGQLAAQGQLPYQQSQANQQNDINNWLAILQAGQANYPLQFAQQAALNGGGVPFIPQSSTNFNF